MILIIAVVVLAAAFWNYVRECALERKIAASEERLKDEKIEAEVFAMSDDQLDNYYAEHGIDLRKPIGKPKF